MRIRSFHIDAFGTLRDVTAEGLPEAGAVFLGHNEAGKSTLLDFFRSTLVGYPRTRDARERGYLAGQSGLLGGSLTLFSDARGGDIRLIRRPNVAKGEPLLTDAQGRPLDPALWERLLGGVTREVYASVYGFSLSELQSFASLTSEGVRNALYGASFGMAGLEVAGRGAQEADRKHGGLVPGAGLQSSFVRRAERMGGRAPGYAPCRRGRRPLRQPRRRTGCGARAACGVARGTRRAGAGTPGAGTPPWGLGALGGMAPRRGAP